MEGPEAPLSPGEIRLLRLLLSMSLELQQATGSTFGPGGGELATVEVSPLLRRTDFENCGQPLPEERPTFPTPVFDAVVGTTFAGALIVLLVVALATGTIYFGPPLVNFARRLLRTLVFARSDGA